MLFEFNEKYLSQIPALQLLISLGYSYIPRAQTLALRQNKLSNVLLEPILREQLHRLNQIRFRGSLHDFDPANLEEAIQRLKRAEYSGGLLTSNQALYDLLSLGTSLEQTIDQTKRSYSLKYIDWDNWQNNAFHVTAEYSVERTRSTETARPDIVLFVNGIPFSIIECKAPSIDVAQAVSQSIRNQRDEYIPNLFVYAHLVIGTNKNASKYATIGTPAKFWATWSEQIFTETQIHQQANSRLSPSQKADLFSGDFAPSRPYFDQLEAAGDRLPTDQDRTLYSLCRPDRLLDIARRFTVFDGGIRKIARYQQYFAVLSILDRIQTLDSQNRRRGGVVWHTQGSGKSLTMVMVAKALALSSTISNPRIILVTDRENLDKQIKATFASCGLEPHRATSGQNLIDLVETDKASIITTIINKFAAARNKRDFCDPSNNIFVLVDESHRSQYGSFNPQMKTVFPNGCYIGFTGTPLMQRDKNTADKFGGIIEPPYTIQQAVSDGAVVPLLYEGRHSESEVNQTAIDTWFERLCKGLTDKEKADLKHKYSSAASLNKAEQIIYCRAFDISEHYRQNWQGTGFKAQLVAPDKRSALRYHQFLKDIGYVSSEVIISGPDTREGHTDIDEEPDDELLKFWGQMMKRHGSEEQYNEQIINLFKSSDDPEILIVVDKLLTGFDAPRNTVLYLTRPLREHALLQAIARVNRLYSEEKESEADPIQDPESIEPSRNAIQKEYGYIIDYVGVLEDLDKALTSYSQWQGFDPADLQQAITNINREIANLPQVHADLLSIFAPVSNSHDEEAYERHLADDPLRDDFYKKLSVFTKTLAIALSSEQFITDTSEHTLHNYRKALKRFQKLKSAVKLRYADAIDYRDLEPKIQKLLDTHISAAEVISISGPVNIFDAEALQTTVTQQTTPASQADLIASNTKRAISIRMEEDPAFYQKFSAMIQEAIDNFRAKRISEQDYLKQTQDICKAVVTHRSDDTPTELSDNDDAIAFFGLLKPTLADHANPEMLEQVAIAAALAILDLIKKRIIRDWTENEDVIKGIEDAIDDYLYDVLRDQYQIDLTPDEKDGIINQSIQLAKNRRTFLQ